MTKRKGCGACSIRRRKEGLYEGRYIVEVKELGKLRRKSVFGRTREEVNKLQEAVVMAHN